MAPIHNTDIAEDRWTQAKWNNYELWEKVEHRNQRRKQLWIFVTCVVFLVLAAVPIVTDRAPKWVSRYYAGRIALAIHALKTQASLEKSAYQLSLSGSGLEYQMYKVQSCPIASTAPVPLVNVQSFPVGWSNRLAKWVGMSKVQEEFVVLTPEQGLDLGIPGLMRDICYDPFLESKSHSSFGFGIISVKDLAQRRLDRLTILLVSGPFAEIVFD